MLGQTLKCEGFFCLFVCCCFLFVCLGGKLVVVVVAGWLVSCTVGFFVCFADGVNRGSISFSQSLSLIDMKVRFIQVTCSAQSSKFGMKHNIPEGCYKAL